MDDLIIRAELEGNVATEVAHLRGELGQLQSQVRKLDQTGSSSTLRSIDSPFQRLGKALGPVSSALDGLDRRLVNFAESTVRRAAVGLGALATAAAGIAVHMESIFETSRLSLDTFLGSVQKGGVLFQQLRGLQNPFQIGDLTAAADALLTVGAAADKVPKLLSSISNIAAVQVDPGGAFTAISDAINRVQETGRLESRSALTFVNNGVDVYGIVARQMGIPQSQVKAILQQQGQIAAPGFLNTLSNMSDPSLARFKNGLADYRKTLPGEIGQLKTTVGNALSDLISPAVPALGRGLNDVDGYVKKVEGRFKLLGPGMLTALKGGQSRSLADQLSFALTGGQSMSKILEPIIRIGMDLPRIVRQDLVPAGRDLLNVLVPALRAVADVFDWLGQHKGVVKEVLEGFLAFEGARKITGVISGLAGGINQLRGAYGTGGWANGLLQFLRGTAGTGGGQGLGGGGGSSIVRGLGAAVPAGLAADALAHGAIGIGNALAPSRTPAQAAAAKNRSKDVAKYAAGGAAAGAIAGSIIPGAGTVIGGIVGGGVGAITGILKGRGAFGDTAHPLSSTLSSYAAFDAMSPGRRYITSGVRSFGLGSLDSDHLTGRALDIGGSGNVGMASRINRSGTGLAQLHGSGPSRHLHAAFGDTARPYAGMAPWGGGGGVYVAAGGITVINPTSNVDVTTAIRDYERQENRRKGRPEDQR